MLDGLNDESNAVRYVDLPEALKDVITGQKQNSEVAKEFMFHKRTGHFHRRG